MFYPLLFKPVYQERVWGGTKLKDLFDKKIPFEHTGESWEIACHKNGMSIVENGEFKGKTILDLMKTYPKQLLGEKFKDIDKFPLLIKILDANDKLSIQVHPQDDYARVNENGELGKCEMWYIIDAKPGAKLVVGTKTGVTKEKFKDAIEKGRLEPFIEELEVQKGDVINIPAGMLHAIQDGIVLAEIQQNSDTTYRVYDWNRVGLDGKPRQLHIDKALDVIDFEGKIKKHKVKGLEIKKGQSICTYYIANKYFAVEKIQVKGNIKQNTDNIKFYLYTCVEGNGIIEYVGNEVEFKTGQSIMIPVALGTYNISGNAVLLKSYVPDVEKDFIKPLKEAGYTEKQIYENIDLF